MWNGISIGVWVRVFGEGENWWYEDILVLSLLFFEKVVFGMEGVGVRGESIWGVVVYYVKKVLLGLYRWYSGCEVVYSYWKVFVFVNFIL